MIVAKCDICNKHTETWKEVNFLIWDAYDSQIEIKEICKKCEDELNSIIKSMRWKFNPY